MTYNKPLPSITPLDRPFWQHAKAHKLHLQRCTHCRHFRYPASPVCPDCGSDQAGYEPVSGKGKIVSWVVFHRCYFPSFEAEIPYNVAIVELEEGPMMISNILAPNDSLHREMPVTVVFEDVTLDVSIPKFKPMKMQ